jgi:hypothetical protein
LQGVQSSYSWRYNGHDEPEREQRRKFRVEKKLQELEEPQDKEAATAALDDTYHDIVEFAHNYFNSHERSPEGKLVNSSTTIHTWPIQIKFLYRRVSQIVLKHISTHSGIEHALSLTYDNSFDLDMWLGPLSSGRPCAVYI